MPSRDETIALASIAVPPTDPLEQYLLEHETDMHMDERDEIDRTVLEQYPILKNNLPVELLGDPPHQRVILYSSLNSCLILLSMPILMKKRYILL